jgi:hypothetical protein
MKPRTGMHKKGLFSKFGKAKTTETKAVPSSATLNMNQDAQDNDKNKELMGHVVSRHFSFAQRILRADPATYFARVDSVKDYSGREFTNISPFEYLFWSGDTRGWNMMLDSLPHDERAGEILKALYDQLINVEKNGIHFKLGDTVYHQKQYDDEAHIAAVRTYVDKHDEWDKAALKAHWINIVGMSQRTVHARIAMKICHVVGKAKHNLAIAQEANSKVIAWFPLENPDLGTKFAITRVPDGAAACEAPSAFMADLTLDIIQLEQDKREFNKNKLKEKLAILLQNALPDKEQERRIILANNLNNLSI